MRLHLPVMEERPSLVNVGQAERLVSGVFGGALLAAAVKRRGVSGFLMGLIGGALMERGVTGRCAMYDALGITSSDATAFSHPLSRQLHATASITILRPVEEVYTFWRNPENLGKVIPHVRSVHVRDDGSSHWVCEPVGGEPLEFDATVTDDVPDERIAWRSPADAVFEHEGCVTFNVDPSGRGTRVRVDKRFSPPGGLVPMAVALAMRKRPASVLASSLRVIKQFLETGEVTTAAPSLSQTDRLTRNWLSLIRQPEPRDQVQEASEESFPASDAPSHATHSRV